ncbi:MAG TPA: serine/threonine-protein kinase [Pirellulales bacterium]|nr:serine/threonine-protein kinase [Pirellulales bacterium]
MATPEQLGPYRIGEPLGRGGMGTVYAAIDTASGEAVAVKVLSAALGREEGVRERFAAEIESLRKLRHRHIVRLLGYGTEDDYHFFAMELIGGRSLEDILRSGRKFEWPEALDLGVQMCQALKHAHDRGIIHRDIKPGNLLLTDENCVKLSDFGIAKLFGNTGVTSEGGVIGTAEYMSPEQADGRPVTHRCDLYSLGGVLYALVAGRPPFRAKSLPEILQLQRFAKPEPLRVYAPGLPIEVEEIVMSLLEKDPENRIPTAFVLSRRLEATRHGLAQQQMSDDEVRVELEDGQEASTDELPEASPSTSAVMETGAGVTPVDRTQPDYSLGDPVKRGASQAGQASIATHATNNPSADVEEPALAEPVRRKFTAVDANDTVDVVQADASGESIWPQSLALAGVLIGVTLLVWFLLQPPSADRIYSKIATAVDDGSIEALGKVEKDIKQFLALYPDDSRADEIRDYDEQLEHNRLERKYARRARSPDRNTGQSSVERQYFDAMAHRELDPATCRRKLRALVDLYGEGSGSALPAAAKECLTLAKLQIEKIDQEGDQHNEADVRLLSDRVARVRRLSESDPAEARRIWQAIVELYADQPWAAPFVGEAKRALGASAAGDASTAGQD